MRLEKRTQTSRTALLLAPIGAIAFTLLISSLLVLWAGAPLAQTYGLLFTGGFGSVFALSETLTRATPLIFTGLAATVAFKARLYNIGAEGQLYAGALAAVAVGGLHGGEGLALPFWFLFILMLLAAALAGALLLLVPALLKAKLGVDEVVTTLLLNFIMLLFVSLMLDGPMKDPTAMGWPQNVALQGELELSKLIAQTRVHTGLLWAIGLAVSLWAMLKFTVPGFDIRATGANARAAVFAGVPHTRWPGDSHGRRKPASRRRPGRVGAGGSHSVHRGRFGADGCGGLVPHAVGLQRLLFQHGQRTRLGVRGTRRVRLMAARQGVAGRAAVRVF